MVFEPASAFWLELFLHSGVSPATSIACLHQTRIEGQSSRPEDRNDCCSQAVRLPVCSALEIHPFPRTRRFKGTGSRLFRRSWLVCCSAEGQTRIRWLLWETGPCVQSKRLRSGRLRMATSRDQLWQGCVPNEWLLSVVFGTSTVGSPLVQQLTSVMRRAHTDRPVFGV